MSPAWKGHSILVQAWPLAPGTLDEGHPDGGVAEPERYTLLSTLKLDLELQDGQGRVLVLAPGLDMLTAGFEPQDASVAPSLEPPKGKSD